jgi:replicative DNA helicase
MKDISLKKLPPHNTEAEISVLGAVLLDNKSLKKIKRTIFPDDFYQSANQKIFVRMLEMFKQKEVIDLVTLSEALNKSGDLKAIGGPLYLMDLMGSTPTATTIIAHAKIVREKSNLRKLITMATNLRLEAYQEYIEPAELIFKAQTKIKDIADNLKSGSGICQ